jgi:hypothetical protein
MMAAKVIVFKSMYVILLIFIVFTHAVGQESQDENIFHHPETVVTEIYKLVSFEGGTTPDWERVKSLFVDKAVIVLRTSVDSMKIVDTQGFVDLFIKDIERYGLEKTGLQETIISLKPMAFGDFAHVFVVYEARVSDSPIPPQRGVDSFQMVKKDGQWRIVSIVNEVPVQGNPIPESFFMKE